jgi:hypothetical protein
MPVQNDRKKEYKKPKQNKFIYQIKKRLKL